MLGSRRLSAGRWKCALVSQGVGEPRRSALEVLQINLGSYCNQLCAHCHVDAGPHRRADVMPAAVRKRVMSWIARHRPPVVDLTGGAPELIAGFRELVRFCSALGIRLIDRCNLTCLFEPGQRGLAPFLARHRVKIVASMPSTSAETVDQQRGRGVYLKSVAGLKLLNAVGYGRPGWGLELDLVYNPPGPKLPPPQAALEDEFREQLLAKHGITFSRLICLTNLPVKRFAAYLMRTNQWEAYHELLSASFEPLTMDRLMCRHTLSIGPDGRVYDCDFNQMLGVPLGSRSKQLWNINPSEWTTGAAINFADHCLGCTAGAGSSCSGQLTTTVETGAAKR